MTPCAMDYNHDESDYVSCSECGLIYNTANHLTKHIQKEHTVKPEEGTDNEETTDGEETDADETVDEEEGENQEEAAFANFYEDATEVIRKSQEWETKYQEFAAQGINEEEAIDSAALKLQGHIEKEALELYRRYLTNLLLFQNGSVHRDIQDDLLRFWDSGFSARRAAKLATNKHESVIKGLMDLESYRSEDDSCDCSSGHDE